MILSRFLIYAGGGFLAVCLWMDWAMSSENGTSLAVLGGIPIVLLLLYVTDRTVHAAWFGQRAVIRIKDYRPCELCPFTKEKGTVLRQLLVMIDGGGFG